MNLAALQKKYLSWVVKASPLYSYVLCIAVLALCLYCESFHAHAPYLYLLLPFIGWLFWGLTEYLMHRFVFHLRSKNKFILFVRYIAHGVHHHEPAKTLFVPLLLRTVVLVITFTGVRLVFTDYSFLLFFGLELGVIQYITVHYCIHHQQLSKYFPKLSHYHYIHHYVEPTTVFGTSSLFWDRVFGTMPSQSYKNLQYSNNKHFIT